MAGKRGAASSAECKKCKKPVVDAATCANCGGKYHPSCGEIVAKYFEDKHFECCEKQETNEDAVFLGAVKNLPVTEIDARYFSLIIKGKYCIIQDLRETIICQRKLIESLLNGKDPEPIDDTKKEKKLQTQVNLKKTDGLVTSDKPADKTPDTRSKKQQSALTYQNVESIHETRKEAENSRETRDQENTQQNTTENWSVFENKKNKNRKSPVIGKSGEPSLTGIKSVPKTSFLFVSRLGPATTCEDLIKYLEKDFPEVTCEKLRSKYPSCYSSFKVTIYHQNTSTALKPLTRSNGILVTRFFQKYRTSQENE
ncbi:hypothetical protein Zmor_023999 [Zophobas morio]|uniref:Uncharacterized protein n=1 Tax=Zophobas morio TaxID=2755281 RepID=A0AA38HZS4_9CUCU|nr:hypothetical protein Zmor_023999 [Zophobas morio]